MSKKKDTIALFEVMKRKGAEGTPAVPQWAQKPASPADATPAPAKPQAPAAPVKPFAGPTVPAAASQPSAAVQAANLAQSASSQAAGQASAAPRPLITPPPPRHVTPEARPAQTAAPAAISTSSAASVSAASGSATAAGIAAGAKPAEMAKPKAGPKLPPPAEPIITRAGNRMKVSLNYVSWAVVGVGMLLALVGSFYLGRSLAHNPPVADNSTPGPVPGSTGREGGVVEGFVAGKNYLIVARLIGNDPGGDAKSIIAFLGDNGIMAAPVTVGSDNVVACTRGFDSPNSAEAERFRQDIIKLAKKHRTGRAAEYDLAKPYYRKN